MHLTLLVIPLHTKTESEPRLAFERERTFGLSLLFSTVEINTNYVRPTKAIYSELAIVRDSAPTIWYFDRGLKADRRVGKHDGEKNEALGILIGGYWHGEDISRVTRGRHPT